MSFFLEQTQEKVQNVELKLRLAEADDLKIDDHTMKFGAAFWLRSSQNGEFQNFPMRITEDTDPHEISTWLELKMIYVPVTWLEDYKLESN